MPYPQRLHRYIRLNGDAADLGGHFFGGLNIEIQYRHFGAFCGQMPGRCGAQPATASGNQRDVSCYLHADLSK